MSTKKPLTQKEKILKLLTPTKRRKFPSLTQQQALADYGIKSLRARITELRDDGYPISSKPFIRQSDGRELVRYVLEI